MLYGCVNFQRKAKGQDLLDKVCGHIDLLEKDYFGLNYVDRQGYIVWVESDKRISKQMKSKILSNYATQLYFAL